MRKIWVLTVVGFLAGAALAANLVACGEPLPETGGEAPKVLATSDDEDSGGDVDDQTTDPVAEEELIKAYAEVQGVTLEEARVCSKREVVFGDYLNSISVEIDDGQADLWIDSCTQGQAVHVRTSNSTVLSTLKEATSQAGIELVIEGSVPIAANGTKHVMTLQDELMKAIPELAGLYVDDETGELVLDLFDKSLADGPGDSTLKDRAIKAAEKITGLSTRVDSINEWAGPASE